MNTGERLVALSGLSHVSAFDHFMAIVTGGVNKTVFASQMTVCSETPETVVSRNPTRVLAPEVKNEYKSASNLKSNKRMDVFMRPSQIHIFMGVDSYSIFQKTKSTFIISNITTEVVTAKNSRH